ncbi:MAG: glycoside hydrolase family 25 protein [Prevotella sp.]
MSKVKISSAVLLALIAGFSLCLISRCHYSVVTPHSSAIISERHYISIVSADGHDTLYAYIYKGGDTLVALPSDTSLALYSTRRRPASWVNHLWIPSCRGTLASRIDTVAERQSLLAGLTPGAARCMMDSKTAGMERMRERYSQQLSEIDYYISTHSVSDEGFDIVARRRDVVVHRIDSLTRIISSARRIMQGGRFSVTRESRYKVSYDSIVYDAAPISSCRKGFLMFRVSGGHTPSGVRPVYLNAPDIGAGMRAARPLMPPLDTILEARRDRHGRYEGFVRVAYPDGTYYEGQCVDTVTDGGVRAVRLRHGFGVEFLPDKVRAGVWRMGRYRGEQPLYTANHIYGIDLSRYQHEPAVQPKAKGRRGKRRRRVTYAIQWDRLRITSLGSMSRKRVSGIVDYPISFIYIKSTEGSSLRNTYFTNDYVSARRHGYRVGAYHFFSTKSPARLQATFFLKHSRYSKGDLPPALDVEPMPSQIKSMGGAAVMLASVRRWLDMVEQRLCVRPIIYVSQQFVNKYLNASYPDGDYLRRNYQVWIARYGEYKPDVHLAIWQLSPDGLVRGIKGHVDINVFNGFEPAFRDFR